MIVSEAQERKRKWNWEYIGDRANAREKYLKIYKKLQLQGEAAVSGTRTCLTD
jgi:hypothetical protein